MSDGIISSSWNIDLKARAELHHWQLHRERDAMSVLGSMRWANPVLKLKMHFCECQWAVEISLMVTWGLIHSAVDKQMSAGPRPKGFYQLRGWFSQQFGYKNVVFRMFSLGLTWSDPNKKRWCVFLEIQSDIQLNTSINPLKKLQNLPHNRRVFKFYFISKSSSESCLHIHEHVGNGNR